jgi:hypothetical protein
MLRDKKGNLTRSRRIMIIRRVVIVTVILFTVATPFFLSAGIAGPVPAGPQAASQGPGLGFGTWAFTGKDKAGVVWKGTLGIEKLDASQFDPQEYIAQGNLWIESAGGAAKGANPPIRYDPATRVFTMGGESDYGGAVYTAVLSPDGKRLTKGTWRETEWSSNTKEKRVVSEGEWSATRIDK